VQCRASGDFGEQNFLRLRNVGLGFAGVQIT
jgi:hypothetical protein